MSETGKRPRGRPRREIDPDAVADAVEQLFAEDGIDSVSIGAAAEKLDVSRATLYRTVPTKEHLVGIVFERATGELHSDAKAIVEEHRHSADQLYHLVRLQIDAAITMREYMPVFFGGSGLPPQVFDRWHLWSRNYEQLWVETVSRAMAEGVIAPADPAITARLLLGMCIWVSRWYRSNEPYRSEDISDAATRLIGSLPAPTAASGQLPDQG